MALKAGPKWAEVIDEMHRDVLVAECESSQMWATVLAASAEGRVTVEWTADDDLRFVVAPRVEAAAATSGDSGAVPDSSPS